MTIALIVIARPAFAQGWEPNVEEQRAPSTNAAPEDAPQPPPASESRPTTFQFEVGADGDYASPPIHGGPNPFGLGLGGHAAITVDDFYFAARVSEFLGSKDVDVSYGALLAGVDAGYEIHVVKLGRTTVTVRPQLGLGDAVISYTDPSLAKVDVVSTASGSSSSSSSDTIRVSNVYVQPGLTAMVSSGVGFFSANESVLVLPGIVYGGADATTWISYDTRLSAGLRF
jgi:hypothetical protein